MQHSTLVSLGVKWLSRQCSVVLYEFAAAGGENPDVMGWATGADSILIECKLTRSDFLRDSAKAARKISGAGMGRRRYYLCPTGIIQCQGSSRAMGITVGGKRPGNHSARGARMPGKELGSRSSLSQCDASSRANTNRYAAALGMAEGREPLGGQTWHTAQPQSAACHPIRSRRVEIAPNLDILVTRPTVYGMIGSLAAKRLYS